MGYEILAIDEASFNLTTTYKKIWFPRGETPRGAFFWSNKKLITFGALTSDHKFFYDFYDAQNSLTFKHFLRYVFEKLDKNKKYILIKDNAGFHKTSCIQKFIAQYKDVVRTWRGDQDSFTKFGDIIKGIFEDNPEKLVEKSLW